MGPDRRFSPWSKRGFLPGFALFTTVALLALAPATTAAVAVPDEIGGDGFDGFDLTPCDASLPSNSSVAAEYAAALDLCAATTEGSRLPGLISATLSLANGAGTPSVSSRSIRPHYGTGTTPRRGSALALLSTGSAAGVGDTNPAFVSPQPGAAASTTSPLPADWLSANNGAVPVPPSCPSIPAATAYDPVMLKLRVRVPNNAHSFSLKASFVAADFPEWTCSSFNDVFVALLDSNFGNPLNPLDKNIATFDGVPTFVDLAMFDNGTFTQCVNGPIGCQSMHPNTITTCLNTLQLAGTGMDAAEPQACKAGQTLGGGTGWFVMRGNVVPGDVIELRLAIWDSGDGTYDSDVALDDFRWSYLPAQAGATPAPP